MNQISNDEILKQVGAVLQFCQEIVSQLSKPQCCCQDYSQQRSESVIVNNLSNILTQTYTSDCDSQYEFSGRSSSESPKLMPDYDTISEADVYDAIADESGKYDAPGPTDTADRTTPSRRRTTSNTLLKKWPTFYNITEVSEDPWMQEMTMSEDVMMQQSSMTGAKDVLMKSVLEFLSFVTPSAIYDPNWREVQRRNAIHPGFYNLWTHYDSIFSDAKDDSVDVDNIKYPAPVNIYHTIDLSNVNARFIENIPKPNCFPVLGVSQNPDFYHKRYDREDSTKSFLSSFPHGGLYGYETNLGIVAPPTEPIHGYVWSERKRSFVLHAIIPEEEGSIPRKRRMRKG